jgi:hypothetical protein
MLRLMCFLSGEALTYVRAAGTPMITTGDMPGGLP